MGLAGYAVVEGREGETQTRNFAGKDFSFASTESRRLALSRDNSPKRELEETQESNVEKDRLRSQVESPRAP